MATRPLPRPTGRPRAGVRPVFEDFSPTSEWKENEQSNTLLLNIHLPGFLTNELKVSTEGKNIIRVRGERLVAGNKWSRFQEDFPVPDDCIMTGIRARLEEGGFLTITIPRKKKQIEDTNIAPKVTPTYLPPQVTTENFTTKSEPTPNKRADIDPRVLDNKETQEITTPRKKKQLVQDANSNIAPKVNPTYLPPQVTTENFTTKSEPTPNKRADIDQRVLDNQKIQEEKIPTLDQLHIRKQTPNKRADEQRFLDDNQRILNKILQEQEKKDDQNVITGQLSKKIQDEAKAKLFGKSGQVDQDHEQKKIDQKVGETKREDNDGSTIHQDKDAAVFLEKFKEIKASKKKEKSAAADATTSSSVSKVRGLIVDMNEERQLLMNMGVAVLVLVALGIQISHKFGSNQDAS